MYSLVRIHLHFVQYQYHTIQTLFKKSNSTVSNTDVVMCKENSYFNKHFNSNCQRPKRALWGFWCSNWEVQAPCERTAQLRHLFLQMVLFAHSVRLELDGHRPLHEREQREHVYSRLSSRIPLSPTRWWCTRARVRASGARRATVDGGVLRDWDTWQSCEGTTATAADRERPGGSHQLGPQIGVENGRQSRHEPRAISLTERVVAGHRRVEHQHVLVHLRSILWDCNCIAVKI